MCATILRDIYVDLWVFFRVLFHFVVYFPVVLYTCTVQSMGFVDMERVFFLIVFITVIHMSTDVTSGRSLRVHRAHIVDVP